MGTLGYGQMPYGGPGPYGGALFPSTTSGGKLQLLLNNGSGDIDITRYVLPSSIQITDAINVPTLLNFSIVNNDNIFQVPKLGAYVKLYSNKTQQYLATGFVSVLPTQNFLGSAENSPNFGFNRYQWDVTVASDEWLLNVKSTPFFPSWIGQTQGSILTSLANLLAPGFFDVSGIQQGDLVAYHAYDPTQKWSDLAKTFGDASGYRYKSLNKKIYYAPYGDNALGITYDETGLPGVFVPQSLKSGILSVPIVNDAIVVGDTEPQNYHDDNFVGDGVSGFFPLRHKLWGGGSQGSTGNSGGQGSGNLLLEEDWTETQRSFLNTWNIADPSGAFQLLNGSLQATGGLGIGASYVEAVNGFELGGVTTFQHGEFFFFDTNTGILGGIYPNANTSLNIGPSGCLVGFDVRPTPGSTVMVTASGASGIQLQPVVSGALVGTAIPIQINHHYILMTQVAAQRALAYNVVYRTLAGSPFGGQSLPTTPLIKFIVIDVDLGKLNALIATSAGGQTFIGPQPNTSLYETTYEFDISAPLPSFANYALLNAVNLNLTVNTTAIYRPPQAVLQVANLTGASGQAIPLPGPTPVAAVSDNFQQANGTPINSANWNSAFAGPTSQLLVSGGNVICANPGSQTVGVASWTGLSPNNQRAKCTIKNNDFVTAGPAVRITGKQCYYACYAHIAGQNYITINRVAANGTLTSISQAVAVVQGSTIGSVLELTVYSSTLSVYENGSLALSTNDGTLTSGSVGFVCSSATGSISNWSGISYGQATGLGGFVNYLLGFSLQNQVGTVSNTGDFDQLDFYTDDIPAAGARIKLRSWEAGKAIARVQDPNNIALQAVISGDDGLRTAIFQDLKPLPRSSADCEAAASAEIYDRENPQYQGQYVCPSNFFNASGGYPVPGRFLYVNSPQRSISKQSFLVTQVTTSIDELSQEQLTFTIQFGQDLYVSKLLHRFLEVDTNILEPGDTASAPTLQTLAQVGSFYINDLPNASVIGVSGNQILVDLGSIPVTGAEVRRSDSGWGQKTPNLIGVYTSRQFFLPRSNFEDIFYVRQVKGAATSRFTSVLRVVAPRIPAAPTGSIDLTDILHPQIALGLNTDIRNIRYIEIRKADNQTIAQLTGGGLAQRTFTSYADFNFSIDNTQDKNIDLIYYCYFVDLMLEYSPPLVLGSSFASKVGIVGELIGSNILNNPGFETNSLAYPLGVQEALGQFITDSWTAYGPWPAGQNFNVTIEGQPKATDLLQNAPLSGNWATNSNPFTINASSQDACPAMAGVQSSARWILDDPTTDQFSIARLDSIGADTIGVAVRMDPGGTETFYFALANNAGIAIWKVINGAYTQLASQTCSPAVGDYVGIMAEGQSLVAYVFSTSGIKAGISAADADIASGQYGLYGFSIAGVPGNSRINSWSGGSGHVGFPRTGLRNALTRVPENFNLQNGFTYASLQSPSNSNFSQVYGYPVRGGDWYYFGGYARWDASAALPAGVNGLVFFQVNFFDANGGLVAFYQSDSLGSANGTWAYLDTAVEVPQNAAYVVFIAAAELNNTGIALNTGNNLYLDARFDDCFLYKADRGSHSSYRPLTNPLSAVDSGTFPTINIASFSMLAGNTTVSVNGGSIPLLTSAAYNTLYFVYYDDPSFSGGQVQFNATTVKETAIFGENRFFVGSIQTPRQGAPSMIGNNDGGSGAQSGMLNVLGMSENIFAQSPPGAGTINNSQSMIDGNLTTFGTLICSGVTNPGACNLVFRAAPGLNQRYYSATLKLARSVTQNDLNGSNSFISYFVIVGFINQSGDGLDSVLFSGDTLLPSSGTIPFGIIEIPLPTNVNLSQIALIVTSNSGDSTAGQLVVNIYDVWIEAIL